MKKALSVLFVCFIILWGYAPVSRANDNFDLGNVIAALQILTGQNANALKADVTENGKVELEDAIFGLQIAAGLRYYNPYPEIVLLAPTDTDKITMAWLPVARGSTGPDDMTYEVHLSAEADFLPGSSTLQTRLTGEVQAEITGLAAGTTYYALVVAIDSLGKRHSGTEYKSVTTFAAPVIMNATPFHTAEDIGLGVPEENGEQYTYTPEPGATVPQTGSLLTGYNSDGDMYLRRVESVQNSGSEIIVQTGEASLSDAMEQGTVSTTINMFDVNAASESMPLSGNTGVRSGCSVKRDGSVTNTIFWKDKLLTAEQTDFALSDENVPGRYSVRSGDTRDTEEEISLEAGVSFTPDLRTEVSWNRSGVQKAEVIAQGKISLEAQAKYNFKTGAEKTIERELFSRSWRTTYPLGTVLVYQKITLNIKAVFTAEASGEIEASTKANASAIVEFGARYNSETGKWDPVFSEQFEKSITANLDIKGEVSGDVRLIPEVNVIFYTAASGSLYLEPFIKGLIGVENVSAPHGITFQPAAFDASLGLDCFAQADLKIICKTIPILSKTAICEPCFEYPLFSLPEIKLEAASGADGITELTAQIKDGVNNPFDMDSIRWETSATGDYYELIDTGIEKTAEGEYTARATFMTCQQGNYDIFFSGFGRLGEIGRRYVEHTENTSGRECTIIYVDDTATGAGTGLTREDAITSLKDAVEQAALVDSDLHVKLILLPGTYKIRGLDKIKLKSNMTLAGENRDQVFITSNGILNSGTIKNCTFSEISEYIGLGRCTGGGVYNLGVVTNCKFIDCSSPETGGGAYNYKLGIIINCDFVDCSAEESGGGVYNQGSVINCTFSNCSVGNGGYNHGKGGGVYNTETGTMTHCVFTDCSASSQGGGSYSLNATETVSDCKFIRCSASTGGGYYGISGLTECAFYNCTASGDGGGAYNHNSNSVTDCIFDSCSARSGGGLDKLSFDMNDKVINCTFSNCSASSQGGGMVAHGGYYTIAGCTFSNCSAGLYGGGLYLSGYITATDCTVTSCSAVETGGGVNNGGFLKKTSISGCSAAYGGGIYNAGRIEDCDVSACSSKIDYKVCDCGGEYRRCLNTGPFIYTIKNYEEESCAYPNCWYKRWEPCNQFPPSLLDCCDLGEIVDNVE